VNVALHVIVSMLAVICFARSQVKGSAIIAAAGGLAFALHPVHAEAVSNVTGRTHTNMAVSSGYGQNNGHACEIELSKHVTLRILDQYRTVTVQVYLDNRVFRLVGEQQQPALDYSYPLGFVPGGYLYCKTRR
jgi:hypothetical protein